MSKNFQRITERYAQTYKEEHRELVKKSFTTEVIDSPVTFEGAQTAAIKVSRPYQEYIKPNKPELLKTAQMASAIIIRVSFKQPGICYELKYEGEAKAFEANKETAMNAFKAMTFKLH